MADNSFQLQQAFALFQQGRFSEATNIYNQLIGENPNNCDALHYFGILKASIGELPEAKALIERSLANKKTYIPYLENYVSILFQAAEYEQAERLSAKAIREHAPTETLAYILAISLYKLGRLRDSVEAFDRLLILSPNNLAGHNEKASALAELGAYDEALVHVEKALKINPRYAEALLHKANILFVGRQYDEALALYQQTLALNSSMPDAYLGYGNVCGGLRRYDEAFAAYDRALALKPDLADAWLGRGNILADLRRYDEALAAYDRALAIRSNLVEAWIGRGNVFNGLKRPDDALAAFDHALALKPDFAEAWLGRGNVFRGLKHDDDAFAAYDKALVLKPDLADAWLGRGNVFADIRRSDEAFAAYDKALALNPDLADAWLGRGNAFTNLKRHDEAIAAYDKALALRPDFTEAWLGLGNALTGLKLRDEAIAAYDKALAIRPDFAEAWVGRGNVLTDHKRYDEAFAAFDKAFTLNPNLEGAEGARLDSKLHLCNWSNFKADIGHLIHSLRSGKDNTSPFVVLNVSDSPECQLQCARLWTSRHFPASSSPIWKGERYKHDKIRIGYLSADFYQHATTFLMAEMFERHDKSRFEIIALSFGPDIHDSMRKRLTGAFDQFIDVRNRSDEDVAQLMRSLEIDIALDLKGFTQDARTGIFSQRAAPIQVNYLGYPGTLGASYIDYLIADQMVIPELSVPYYDEKIVYLPDSYQVNDSKRPISDRSFSRGELGLPQDGFVFCCFNNSYKITPDVFDCWARILKTVEDSVLWLFEDNTTAASNLRKEATARGVNAERLVFAQRMPLRDHLARHRVADLFLDTLPYNAHTTASDALWAGLPVLTQIGQTFAGRVAASLLNTIGLPELITTTQQAYEELAVELAADPGKLANIKRKLADNRLSKPLFDTQLFTRHIESAYQMMHERYRQGLAPDHINVPS